MQLKTIKVSGFKSFADPTSIPFKSHLTAIVGPNGCGKSNVVDAIRCVLSGAARHLRGDTLPDVIFNGSSNRKPVGQASVEMLFDNADGGFGGEYAAYPEISVRREVNRDGTSDYFLNGVRCRRRDVLDVFLGTGLGPQSYAIIEQGMISRIIEAKPEELRIYLEEAAGISKYKERRRETENRLQHTRENLERLSDHRLELEKQLNHLQRQANAAVKYQELRQEERMSRAQLQCLYSQDLQQQLQTRQNEIETATNQYEATMAELRQWDTTAEKLRQDKIGADDQFGQVQQRFYSYGAEIARLEQQLQNLQERRSQLLRDLEQVEKNHQDIQEAYASDQLQIKELKEESQQLEPRVAAAREAAELAEQQLSEAEQTQQDWQIQWDEFQQRAAKVAQSLEVEHTRINHLQQQLAQAEQRIGRLEQERAQINFAELEQEIAALHSQDQTQASQLQQLQQELNQLQTQVQQQREVETHISQTLDKARHELQQLSGRRSSLETLQQAALGKTDQAVKHWLEQQQLQAAPRLAENLRVAEGWEFAVETALGPYLEAICIDDMTSHVAAIQELQTGQLLLVTNPAAIVMPPQNKLSLADMVEAGSLATPMLANIYVAENLTEALSLITDLQFNESIMTRDGIWLGKNWLRIAKTTDAKAGILQREKELRELNDLIVKQQNTVSSEAQNLSQLKQQIQALQQQREQTQQQFLQLTSQNKEAHWQWQAKRTRLEQLMQREKVLAQELQELQIQRATGNEHLQQAQQQQQQAVALKAELEQERQELQTQREELRRAFEVARAASRNTQEQADELQLRLESSRSQLHLVQQNLQRAEKQLQVLVQQRDNLQQNFNELEQPLAELKEKLAEQLQQRLEVEQELELARQQVNHIEHDLRESETKRQIINDSLQQLRTDLEQQRMQLQAIQLKLANHQEKITELGFVFDEIKAQLPELANIAEWEEKIVKLEEKIQRLGPINLAAIDEHKQLSERKDYLDAQNNDLNEAIEMLENAIRKIDKESRTKLQETYDKVNTEFNKLFQQVFNGGNAQLELTEGDLLSSGIVVKAQPPGKRNSTIHLLSGGEKALTAISLVFALFQLNPAPFCVLDEVDAPLDDVNVGRFCALVQEMSKKVQFIFISHNKVTIEMANQLMGVTMHEPGVSRIVSVDMQQAVALATA